MTEATEYNFPTHLAIPGVMQPCQQWPGVFICLLLATAPLAWLLFLSIWQLLSNRSHLLRDGCHLGGGVLHETCFQWVTGAQYVNANVQ